jgi:hypothetical protein
MRQATLEEFIQLKPKCHLCGRLFKSIKALNTHLSKAHPNQEPLLIYADEGMEITHKGYHVEMKVRMRRTLWKDLERRAQEAQMTLDELVFQTLTNLAAFGREWELWTETLAKKPTYIT